MILVIQIQSLEDQLTNPEPKQYALWQVQSHRADDAA